VSSIDCQVCMSVTLTCPDKPVITEPQDFFWGPGVHSFYPPEGERVHPHVMAGKKKKTAAAVDIFFFGGCI
jgi:hypothetical protein